LFIFILKIRLIFTIIFNVCFIPFAFTVIKDYDRDEFSKRYVFFCCIENIFYEIFNRLFGAFPAARLPLKIYSIFDCVARINTMLSVDSLFDFSN